MSQPGWGLPSQPPAQLSQVMPSAAAAIGVPGFEDAIGLAAGDAGSGKGAGLDVAVVVLVDGMGIHQLREHPARAPFLSELDDGSSHAVTAFPATTATALTTLGTGADSGVHGIVGTAFHMEGFSGMFQPLHWRDTPNPIAAQPLPTVFERVERAGVDTYTIGPMAYATSGLTRAGLRGSTYLSADTFGQRLEALGHAVRKAPALVYVYWPELDKSGHVNGPGSRAWQEDLRIVDMLCQGIAEALPARSAMVVTADHGMVDVPDSRRINLDALPHMLHHVSSLGGEPRMRHVYTQPKAAQSVRDTWAHELGDRADVLTRDEAIDAGLFGEVEPWFADRIGHVVAIPTGNWALCSPSVDGVLSSLRGQHGGREPAEVDVPLLVKRT